MPNFYPQSIQFTFQHKTYLSYDEAKKALIDKNLLEAELAVVFYYSGDMKTEHVLLGVGNKHDALNPLLVTDTFSPSEASALANLLGDASTAGSVDYKIAAAAKVLESSINSSLAAVDASLQDLETKAATIHQYALEAVTLPEDSSLKAQYAFSKDGSTITTIDIPKDQYLKSAEFISAATEADHAIDSNVIVGDSYIKLTWNLASAESVTYVPMKKLVDTYVGSDFIGIQSSSVGNVIYLKYADLESSIFNQIKADALDAIDASLNALASDVSTLKADDASILALAVALDASSKAAAADISALKTDVADLKTADASAATAIAALDASVKSVAADVSSLAAEVKDISKGVDISALKDFMTGVFWKYGNGSNAAFAIKKDSSDLIAIADTANIALGASMQAASASIGTNASILDEFGAQIAKASYKLDGAALFKASADAASIVVDPLTTEIRLGANSSLVGNTLFPTYSADTVLDSVLLDVYSAVKNLNLDGLNSSISSLENSVKTIEQTKVSEIKVGNGLKVDTTDPANPVISIEVADASGNLLKETSTGLYAGMSYEEL